MLPRWPIEREGGRSFLWQSGVGGAALPARSRAGRGCTGTLRREARGRAVRSGARGSGVRPVGGSAVSSPTEAGRAGCSSAALREGPRVPSAGGWEKRLQSCGRSARNCPGRTARSGLQAAAVPAVSCKVCVWSVPVGSPGCAPCGPFPLGNPVLLRFLLPIPCRPCCPRSAARLYGRERSAQQRASESA